MPAIHPGEPEFSGAFAVGDNPATGNPNVDFFSVEVNAGDRVVVFVSPSDGFAPALRLFTGSGSELDWGGDTSS